MNIIIEFKTSYKKEELMTKEQALGMEKIAKGPFAPIYPAMAKELLEKSQKKCGVCLDIGGGGGQLGLNIKALTNMEVVNLDINPYTVEIAMENAKEMGQADIFRLLQLMSRHYQWKTTVSIYVSAVVRTGFGRIEHRDSERLNVSLKMMVWPLLAAVLSVMNYFKVS
jgi:predicted RNA methylase